MADTTLNRIKTKIALKILTPTEWENLSKNDSNKYTPMRGEVCLCEVAAATAGGAPTVLFKVGDGTHTFSELNWATAPAADVYEWAKAEHAGLNGEIIEFYNGDGNDKTVVHSIDLSKFALDATVGDLTQLTTTSKGTLVDAINEVRQAVDVGGTGSVVSVQSVTPSTGNQKAYQIFQGDKAVAGPKIEIPNVPEVDYPDITITNGTAIDVSAAATVDVYSVLTPSEHTITGQKASVVTQKGVADAIDAYEVFGVDMETVNALGGIAAGTNLKDKTLHEVLNELLFPYVKPAVGTPARTPSTTSALEMGNNQTITAVSVTVTKKSKPITNVALYQGSTKIAEKSGTDKISSSSTALVKDGGTIKFESLNISVPSTNVTLTVKVTDESGTVVTSGSTANWSFVYPYYYGVCAAGKTAATLTEAEIEAMTKDIKAKGEKSYTYTTDNQKMVIAYPKAHGVLKKALDPNGFDYLANGYERAEINITGLNGTSQPYYVYAQKEPSFVTSFVMKYQY